MCSFWIGGHVWQKWEVFKAQQANDGRIALVQERQCKVCGLKQIRRDVA